MGNGYFDGSKLHFVVAALFPFSGNDEGDCRDALDRASIFLHQATFGQVQFGTIYLSDNSLALFDAEVLLIKDATATSAATLGKFGVAGNAVSLMDDTRTKPNLIVHEFGHHLWDLGDEYRSEFHRVTIDRSSTPSDNLTVPIVEDPELSASVPPGTDFLTVFSNQTQRRRIASNTSTSLTLQNPLPDRATSADNTRGDVQFLSKCGNPFFSHASFCIMELEAASTTGFCDEDTHVRTEDSEQQTRHNGSCWKTIIESSGYGHLLPPPGPAQQPQLDPINVVRLQASARFALLMDISGSMQGEQLTYAKAGIAYWLDNLSATGDRLSVIAFNDQASVALPLTLAGPNLDLVAVNAQIDTLAASGSTDIRGAIREGIDQIVTGAAGISAVQAVVLLTDGQHNTPPGTSVSETLDDLRNAHVKLAAIGIGGPDDVDTEELNDLATATNGFSSFIDVAQDVSEIESAMIEANLKLLGELFEFADLEVLPPPPKTIKDAHPKLKPLYSRKAHVGLSGVLRTLGVTKRKLLEGRGTVNELGGLFTVRPFLVEQGCESINCVINFNHEDNFDLWLLDPALKEMESGNAGVRLNRDASHPHRFCMVNKPKAGVWRAVMLRLPTSKANRDRRAIRVHLSIGGRHREVSAVARTRKAVFSRRESVVIEAQARWVHPLTGLRVQAEVRDRQGLVTRITLRDGELLSDDAGTYLGEFRPTKPGKYQALVRISNPQAALRADGGYLATHAPASAGVDLRTHAKRFHRVVPLTFEVLK